MGDLFLLMIVVGLIVYLRSSNRRFDGLRAERPLEKYDQFKIMEIPVGYCPSSQRNLYLHGVHHRLKSVLAWAQGKNLGLDYEPEINENTQRPAIRVIGTARGAKRYHIGFVAEKLVGDLYDYAKDGSLRLRLMGVRIVDDPDGYNSDGLGIFIAYQALIPCEKKEGAIQEDDTEDRPGNLS